MGSLTDANASDAGWRKPGSRVVSVLQGGGKCKKAEKADALPLSRAQDSGGCRSTKSNFGSQGRRTIVGYWLLEARVA